MQLGSEAQIPDGLLAANALLGENSHQGVPTSTHALYQGFGFVISNTALGMRGSLYDEGVGSRYTGKERDAESGLDYFGARYYSSNMGRWSSPDWSKSPSGVPYADLSNPQSLNLYSYVHNNPLSNIDDDGHATIEIRYTSIGPGYTHSYLVVTNTNGARTYFRAGPSAGGPSSGSSGALSSASGGSSGQSSNSTSNSSNGSSPGSGPGGADANTGRLEHSMRTAEPMFREQSITRRIQRHRRRYS